jgi:hypothetical protein
MVHSVNDIYSPELIDFLNFNTFKQWLEKHPYIRSLAREALMPRVWSMRMSEAVKPMILPPIEEKLNVPNEGSTKIQSINRGVSGNSIKNSISFTIASDHPQRDRKRTKEETMI